MKLLIDLNKYGVTDKVIMLDHAAVVQVQRVIAEAAIQRGESASDLACFVATSMLIRGIAAAGKTEPETDYCRFLEQHEEVFSELIAKCLAQWDADGASREDFAVRIVWQLASVGFGCGFAYGIDSFVPTGSIPNIPKDYASPEKQAWAKTFIASCPGEILTS